MSDIASVDVEFWTKLGAGVMTFLGGAFAVVGGREGAADRQKPAPDPGEAGPVSLMADGRTLTRIAESLDDLAGDFRAWRRVDEERRHDAVVDGRMAKMEANQGAMMGGLADLTRAIDQIRRDAGPYEKAPKRAE